MPLIIVPKVLREKLGEEGADALVDLINVANGQAKADVLTFVEEKFERRLSEEVAKLDVKISEEVAKLDVKISEEVAKLDVKISGVEERFGRRLSEEVAKLDVKISAVKADLIRWMFIFWVGQLGAIMGLLFVFFRK